MTRTAASPGASPGASPAARRLSGVRSAAVFAGPAFLVSVGYVDPGNWGTDLAAGSRYGYSLLWVLVASSLLALLLQHLAVRLGIGACRDLADVLGSRLGPAQRRAYAVLAVGAMLVTEVAEFLGVVVALQLLFGLPLGGAVVLATFFDRGLVVESLGQAHEALEPLLGTGAAMAFAVALLAAGLASCVTGGMASQLVLDGLVLTRRRPPLLLRLLVALVPATVVLSAGVGEIEALLWTQVVLSLTLPFVVVPLVVLCRDRELMGELALRGGLLVAAAAAAALLVVLNVAGLLALVL